MKSISFASVLLFVTACAARVADSGSRDKIQSSLPHYDFEALHGAGAEATQFSSMFKQADANGDGKMDFAEWVVSSMDKSELESFAARWVKFDREGKGYMTEDEAFERTA